jgi:hypothetical protein
MGLFSERENMEERCTEGNVWGAMPKSVSEGVAGFSLRGEDRWWAWMRFLRACGLKRVKSG